MAERREISESREYALVRLHLDDVEAIESILRDLGTESDEVTVSSERWSASTVTEVAEKEPPSRPLTELSLSRYRPHLSLSLEANSARLYVGDVGDLAAAGAFYRIDDLLRRRQRNRFSRFFATAYCLPIPIAVQVGGFQLFPRHASAVSAATLLLAAVLVSVSYYLAQKRCSLVHLVPRDSRRTFLRRNADNLALIAISAVLGAAAGVGGTLLTVSLGGSS